MLPQPKGTREQAMRTISTLERDAARLEKQLADRRTPEGREATMGVIMHKRSQIGRLRSYLARIPQTKVKPVVKPPMRDTFVPRPVPPKNSRINQQRLLEERRRQEQAKARPVVLPPPMIPVKPSPPKPIVSTPMPVKPRPSPRPRPVPIDPGLRRVGLPRPTVIRPKPRPVRIDPGLRPKPRPTPSPPRIRPTFRDPGLQPKPYVMYRKPAPPTPIDPGLRRIPRKPSMRSIQDDINRGRRPRL